MGRQAQSPLEMPLRKTQFGAAPAIPAPAAGHHLSKHQILFQERDPGTSQPSALVPGDTQPSAEAVTDSSPHSAPKHLPSNYLHKKLLRNVFVWKALITKKKGKKNWHEELCILQNKMCCFLICFYNPNKFVSHTPRLEKGVVLQFRIAVCSQLRQRICCKAVAARKRRSPAVLWLHRCWPLLCTRTATTSPSRWGRGARDLPCFKHRSQGKQLSSHTHLCHLQLVRTRWLCRALRGLHVLCTGIAVPCAAACFSCRSCSKPRQCGLAKASRQ